jgi:hypothetical protein
LSSFTHRFRRGIKGKRTKRGSWIHPSANPEEKGLKTATRNSPRKGSENHRKGKWERHNQALRNHVESSIHTMKVHTRFSLSPDHPSLSQDLTIKLSS